MGTKWGAMHVLCASDSRCPTDKIVSRSSTAHLITMRMEAGVGAPILVVIGSNFVGRGDIVWESMCLR
jgi:hypothetical protein